MKKQFEFNSIKRRDVLMATGAATLSGVVGLGVSGSVLGWEDTDLVVEQGGECIQVMPLQSSEDVVDLYNYRPEPGVVNNRQSNLPVQLEREQTSRLFLYDGPQGFSLVILQGSGTDEQGGAATFHVCGLPVRGDWVVLDDSYENANDEFLIGDQEAILNWGWGAGGRNDGAVFRGFSSRFCVNLRPWFDEDATLDSFNGGKVEAFQFLSGNFHDPDVIDLDIEQPLTIRTGDCGDEVKGCVMTTQTVTDPFAAEVTFCCTSVVVDVDEYEEVRLNFLDGTDRRFDGPFEGLTGFMAEDDDDGNPHDEIIRTVMIKTKDDHLKIQNPSFDRCRDIVADKEETEEGGY